MNALDTHFNMNDVNAKFLDRSANLNDRNTNLNYELYGLQRIHTSRNHGAGSRYVSFRENAPSNLRSVGLHDPTFRRIPQANHE